MTHRFAAGLLGLAVFAATLAADPKPEEPKDSAEKAKALKLTLGEPVTHANLTVYPVRGPQPLAGTKYLTLAEAMERKKAKVAETGRVSQLTVANSDNKVAVFIESGDIVKGGKQDRTLPLDTIVPPESKPIPLASHCVEQGRWAKRGGEQVKSFYSANFNLAGTDLKQAQFARLMSSTPAGPNAVDLPNTSGRRAVRALAQAGRSRLDPQSATWKAVAENQKRLKDNLMKSVADKRSPTSLQLTLESKALAKAVKGYTEALKDLAAGQGVVGYVVLINGEPMSADVYGSAALFRKVWPKALRSVATEAISVKNKAKKDAKPLPAEKVKEFLDAAGAKFVNAGQSGRAKVSLFVGKTVMLADTYDTATPDALLHRRVLKRGK